MRNSFSMYWYATAIQMYTYLTRINGTHFRAKFLSVTVYVLAFSFSYRHGSHNAVGDAEWISPMEVTIEYDSTYYWKWLDQTKYRLTSGRFDLLRTPITLENDGEDENWKHFVRCEFRSRNGTNDLDLQIWFELCTLQDPYKYLHFNQYIAYPPYFCSWR